MMKHEFTDLTGFEPSTEEYEEIEEMYYAFDGDKREFCKYFVATGGIQKIYDERLATIERLRSTMMETEKNLMNALKEKDKKIEALEANLEKEQEWQPHEDSHNVKQADYSDLLSSCGTKKLTDDEAADMIAEEFGFDRSKITIVHTVAKEEINRHNQCRRVGEYERDPLFNAWDWNYIRFNIRGNVTMSYEMHNGELQMFWC